MTTTKLLAIGLGAGLLLGTGAAIAQNKDDDRQSTSPTDAVTKPLGDTTGQAGATTGDRSTQSGSPLGASGSNPAQQNLSFGVLDINTDGKLSKDEVKGNATLTSDFSKLDADRNGSLSNGEFAAFETQGGAKSGDSSKSGESSKAGKAERKTQRAGDKAENKAERAGDKAEDEAKDTMD
jgi:hypothetical protein